MTWLRSLFASWLDPATGPPQPFETRAPHDVSTFELTSGESVSGCRLADEEEIEGFQWAICHGDEVTVADDDAVIGFLARRDDWIDALYLSAARRGMGIGTALLRSAMSVRPRLELWAFQANVPARKFYAAHGFVEDRFTDGAGNDENLPDVHMTWEAG